MMSNKGRVICYALLNDYGDEKLMSLVNESFWNLCFLNAIELNAHVLWRQKTFNRLI